LPSSYWDLPYNNFNYSYVNVAVNEHGFSTLTWDRIGVGESDHPDPLLDVQASLSEQALKFITDLIRNGTFPGVDHEFEKIYHVGHSIGSALTLSLIRDYPTISDGAVLTSFSANGTWADYFMLGSNWLSTTEIPRFSKDYPAGYIAWNHPSGIQTAFLAPGEFDPEALLWVANNTSPTSPGEILQVGVPARNNFTGPLLVITGERDLVFCGGDCYQTGDSEVLSILNSSNLLAPDAVPLETIVVPRGGHGLNIEYGHKQTYADINKFLLEH
jgi:pimeloyl-ACP methyl ester carboxylesterase